MWLSLCDDGRAEEGGMSGEKERQLRSLLSYKIHISKRSPWCENAILRSCNL